MSTNCHFFITSFISASLHLNLQPLLSSHVFPLSSISLSSLTSTKTFSAFPLMFLEKYTCNRTCFLKRQILYHFFHSNFHHSVAELQTSSFKQTDDYDIHNSQPIISLLLSSLSFVFRCSACSQLISFSFPLFLPVIHVPYSSSFTKPLIFFSVITL